MYEFVVDVYLRSLKRRPGKSGSDSDKKTKSSSKSKSFDGYQGSSPDPQTNSQESMLYFVYYCSKFVFLDSQPSLSSSSSTCFGVPCFEASLLHGMYSVRELLQVPSDQERGLNYVFFFVVSFLFLSVRGPCKSSFYYLIFWVAFSFD